MLRRCRSSQRRSKAFPRRIASGFCKTFRPIRAWGMPGARCTRSLAWDKSEPHERSHHGRAGFTRHSRTRMVLTVSFALSLVTGLFCHHPRVMRSISRVDASVGASGPHDFAVHLARHSSKALRRPPHPAPTFVTIAKRPSWRARDGIGSIPVSTNSKSGKFLRGDWTAQIRSNFRGKLPIAARISIELVERS